MKIICIIRGEDQNANALKSLILGDEYRNYVLHLFSLKRSLIIVAFLENATIGYSLESLCVCVRMCVSVCVCVFLHDN